MVDKFEILSLNVRGLGMDVKRRKLFTWLNKQDLALVMLQETHSTREIENKWRTEWGGEAYFSHGSSRARGTVILFKPSLKNVEVHSCQTDGEGRFVILDVTINDIRVTLANIYGPNDEP
jgi:exonuclease III